MLGGHARIRLRQLALDGGVLWQDERIVVVLKHIDDDAVRKMF